MKIGETNPQDVLELINKGVALGYLGKYEEAITCFDNALKIDPHDLEAWYNKGVALENLGRHEEAITCFDNALGNEWRRINFLNSITIWQREL